MDKLQVRLNIPNISNIPKIPKIPNIDKEKSAARSKLPLPKPSRPGPSLATSTAPASLSFSTTAAWPNSAAQCSAVLPRHQGFQGLGLCRNLPAFQVVLEDEPLMTNQHHSTKPITRKPRCPSRWDRASNRRVRGL